MTLRKIHRLLGGSFGLLVLLIAGSGCILIFTEELNLHGHAAVEPGPAVADLRPALAELLERHPGSRIRSVYLPRMAGDAAERKTWLVFMERPGHVGRWVGQVDPYSGRIVGEHDYGGTAFRIIFGLHTGTLFGGWGGLIWWLAAFALLLSGLSGFWIYRKALRRLFSPRFLRQSWRKPVLAHATTGTAALVFVILLSLTGAFLMYLVVPPKFERDATVIPMEADAFRQLPDLARAQAIAGSAVPGSRVAGIGFEFADPSAPRIAYTLLDRSRMPWNKWSRVWIDGRDGSLATVELPADSSPYRRLVMTAVTLHFGFYGSEPTQWVYLAFGLLIVFLPLSGFWLLVRKRGITARSRSTRS